MKRFSAIIALLLAFSFTACSNSTKNNNQEQSNTTKTNSVISDTEEVSETNRENFYEKTTAEEVSNQNINTTDTKETTKKSETKPYDTTTQKTTNADKPVPTTKPQPTPAPSKKLPNYTPESEIVTLFNKINKYREEKGLNKLVLDPELCKMAYIRAEEQKVLKGHTRPDNSKYYSILDEYNYSYMGCGENIAFVGEISADRAFNLWKNSSTHNQNMLEPRWTKSGIAVHKYIDGTYSIVQIFVA